MEIATLAKSLKRINVENPTPNIELQKLKVSSAMPFKINMRIHTCPEFIFYSHPNVL
jgi:hypothetical protein